MHKTSGACGAGVVEVVKGHPVSQVFRGKTGLRFGKGGGMGMRGRGGGGGAGSTIQSCACRVLRISCSRTLFEQTEEGPLHYIICNSYFTILANVTCCAGGDSGDDDPG